jgi:hypothetical protein
MSRSHLNPVVFLAGLAAVCWVGAGYLAANPLALAFTLLVGACYVAGALELRRYQQTTVALAAAVDGLTEPPPSLAPWLDQLPAGLRGVVRLRIDGERAALPGPALTPYLVGLLVLLGMLGTLLGMVATLKGTGAALESAADLQAIRASLASPVKGLGFAFGTSIAGVATSAMLGLLSALCRRERAQVGQRLDAALATTLRIHSHAHQRDETARLLQRQAEALPLLAERMQSMVTALEQHGRADAERQLANQQAFLGRTETAYAQLAASVGQSLRDSATDSAHAVGGALQPLMEATLAGLARETGALHGSVSRAVERQLEQVSNGFTATAAQVSGIWTDALARQQREQEALVRELRDELAKANAGVAQRSAALLDGMSARADEAGERTAAAWRDALTGQAEANAQLAERNQQALERAATGFETRAAVLLAGLGEALDRQAQVNEQLATHNRQALDTASSGFERQAATLLSGLSGAHAGLQAELAARDEARLAAWRDALGAVGATLEANWTRAGEQAESRQHVICETLARTAGELSEQARAQARDTLAELAGLARETSAAPRAAADLVAQLARTAETVEQRSTALLDGVATHLDTAAANVAGAWREALDRQAEVNAQLATHNTQALEAASNGFEQQASALLGGLGEALDRQAQVNEQLATHNKQALEAASSGFEQQATALLGGLGEALDRQAQVNEQLATHNKQALEAASSGFERQAAALLSGLGDTLSRQTQANEQSAAHHKQALEAVSSGFEQQATALLGGLGEALDRQAQVNEQLATHNQQALETASSGFERQAAALLSGLGDTLSRQTQANEQSAAHHKQALEAVSSGFEQQATALLGGLGEALDRQAQVNEQLATHNQQALETASRGFERQAAALLDGLGNAHVAVRAELVARDDARLAVWRESLGAVAATLDEQWTRTGEAAAHRQQAICDALARAAEAISAQTHAHARDTIAELGQLVQAASEAPRVAAEVVAEMRQKLSDSMVRDTAMLEERSRLLATLETLLGAVNHASTEQRAAIDALVSTSSDLLARVGSRFSEQVDNGAGRLDAVAAQVTGSAAEVASLGEAFGAAVQVFGEANGQLVTHLERVESALDRSLTRSDEQLAYYVAQAREVIDLSMLSQKQIVEELQRAAAGRAALSGADAA